VPVVCSASCLFLSTACCLLSTAHSSTHLAGPASEADREHFLPQNAAKADRTKEIAKDVDKAGKKKKK
jgi:hypothetical protein